MYAKRAPSIEESPTSRADEWTFGSDDRWGLPMKAVPNYGWEGGPRGMPIPLVRSCPQELQGSAGQMEPDYPVGGIAPVDPGQPPAAGSLRQHAQGPLGTPSPTDPAGDLFAVREHHERFAAKGQAADKASSSKLSPWENIGERESAGEKQRKDRARLDPQGETLQGAGAWEKGGAARVDAWGPGAPTVSCGDAELFQDSFQHAFPRQSRPQEADLAAVEPFLGTGFPIGELGSSGSSEWEFHCRRVEGLDSSLSLQNSSGGSSLNIAWYSNSSVFSETPELRSSSSLSNLSAYLRESLQGLRSSAGQCTPVHCTCTMQGTSCTAQQVSSKSARNVPIRNAIVKASPLGMLIGALLLVRDPVLCRNLN
eukprot:jgi/Botrbrau1/21731/Bobra.43_1s0125.1